DPPANVIEAVANMRRRRPDRKDRLSMEPIAYRYPGRAEVTGGVTRTNAADRGSAAPESGRSSGRLPYSRPCAGWWASCARTVGSGSVPMYLPLTYTLLEAAIALDREATTMTVAIASLLNMGSLRLLASRCGSLTRPWVRCHDAKVTWRNDWNDV